MKILKITSDNNITINNEVKFQTDLGWADNFVEFEDQSLEQIVNVPENYETVRYIHKPYSGITTNTELKQTDIWFYFYFISGNTYVQNYEATGLLNNENTLLLKQTTQSFFRLEFYKTPNNDKPDRSNRKLVFAKNLTLPSGEKFFITKENFNDLIYVPVFTGNNYRNKENMYIFWFQDETPYDDSPYTGNTFWMTAKYFNAKTGDILDFTNICMSKNEEIFEIEDLYYQMEIDRLDYSYQIFLYDGEKGVRVGDGTNPIKFYEKGGAIC